ncbi:hypothetical protein E2C01_035048 [Portunus trituberculatus]|uniref:Uncharacterized protein n=1 Tax=Portunus trituberculatus TaxID=210409 RepID=A0A5B7F827_PORTR|nr:hypothetical protein [Portunus trituberculatus]
MCRGTLAGFTKPWFTRRYSEMHKGQNLIPVTVKFVLAATVSCAVGAPCQPLRSQEALFLDSHPTQPRT